MIKFTPKENSVCRSLCFSFCSTGCGEVGDEVIALGRLYKLKVIVEPTPTPTPIPPPVVVAI